MKWEKPFTVVVPRVHAVLPLDTGLEGQVLNFRMLTQIPNRYFATYSTTFETKSISKEQLSIFGGIESITFLAKLSTYFSKYSPK